jgi:hypothetical protein
VALDWLEFGVSPAAPPEVLVWMIPVRRLLETLVIGEMPNPIEKFATSPCSEPPVAEREPVSAPLTFEVTVSKILALAITPVASPLKEIGVVCACVVANIDENNIAVILSNVVKKNFLFIIFYS